MTDNERIEKFKGSIVKYPIKNPVDFLWALWSRSFYYWEVKHVASGLEQSGTAMTRKQAIKHGEGAAQQVANMVSSGFDPARLKSIPTLEQFTDYFNRYADEHD